MTIEIKPDWSKAPWWANYWAVDIDGSAFWYEKEPEPNFDDECDDYGMWTGDKYPVKDEEWVKNWKETLQERPKEAVVQDRPQPIYATEADLICLLNEFHELMRLLIDRLQ